ncbi:MAG: GNAT family N-acetyltransferase [Chloroflexota bacterium]|nr:GNAT family N-acetyltransferase [Chloroflexota bacterium]
MEQEPSRSLADTADESSPGSWTLRQVRTEERALTQRLFEFYLYDFSELEHSDVDEEGWFVPSSRPWLERYWTEPGKHALLLRVDGKPAGFVLLDESSPIAGSGQRRFIGAFFVARAYRRRGFGGAMALAVFQRFPGAWQVLQVRANAAAQAFWRRIIGAHTGARYEERWVSEREIVQEFDTRDRAGDQAVESEKA